MSFQKTCFSYLLFNLRKFLIISTSISVLSSSMRSEIVFTRFFWMMMFGILEEGLANWTNDRGSPEEWCVVAPCQRGASHRVGTLLFGNSVLVGIWMVCVTLQVSRIFQLIGPLNKLLHRPYKEFKALIRMQALLKIIKTIDLFEQVGVV